ncbi:hypothetical protein CHINAEXTREME_18175 [Halobiforma lacisalsi AJ5]|uniref:C2H2-type domain-containing protein n=2 Tax=Natronobacterium lacisalsi AJ5 TaxID=358396 RepID=A0A1P8LUU5_NATLA|nr:hypothetical protein CHINAEXTREME_18175 [Halobiforma lacisalsi AJ5]
MERTFRPGRLEGCPADFVDLADLAGLAGLAGLADLASLVGETHLRVRVASSRMVVQTERDDATWYECENCGLLFDEKSDAAEHEQRCDDTEPSYIQ